MHNRVEQALFVPRWEELIVEGQAALLVRFDLRAHASLGSGILEETQIVG